MQPNNTIPHKTNDIFKEKQKTYPTIFEALARILHLIGKQGTAYGVTEGKVDDTLGNTGNFLAIVHEINDYPLLHEHIYSPLRNDVSCT